jgi:hypothetical protein
LASARSEERRLAAATKYLELRGSAGRDVESRRALAQAESALAGELRDGRVVMDSGHELSARRGGRVRVREPRSERPDRDIARARRHGYTGDDDTMRSIGQRIRVAIRGLNQVEMDALLEHFDGEIAAAIDSDDPDDLPARTPTPTPPATPTGWMKDGTFHVTRSQLRDAAFTAQHQRDISKAGMDSKLTIVEES